MRSPGFEPLKLIPYGEGDWSFQWPKSVTSFDDVLDQGIDCLDSGKYSQASQIFRTIIRSSRQHIDAYHHLALVHYRTRNYYEARKAWEKAVMIAFRAFPPNFVIGKDMLPWGIIDNRPFLRALHGYGTIFREFDSYETVYMTLYKLMLLNPPDNQGVRCILVECAFRLCIPGEAIRICKFYPGDTTSELLYARPLAYYMLGRNKEAESALKEAVSMKPLVAEELCRPTHRPQKGYNPDLIAIGSKEEAYSYWTRFGEIWRSFPGALDFLKTGSAASMEVGRPNDKTVH